MSRQAAEGKRMEKKGRSRQARWDRKHIKTASCRLTIEEMEELRRACADRGTTIYSAIRRMIAEYLGGSPRGDSTRGTIARGGIVREL